MPFPPSTEHPPSSLFPRQVFPGTLPRVVDRSSVAPVSRATGDTMSNRVCCVFVKLIVLSMLVITVDATGCSSGKGLRVGTTGGTTTSTAGATVDVTNTTGGTTGTIGNTGGGSTTSTTVGIPSYAGTAGTTGP